MPNRMLRDWTGSDKINSVSVHAERFFTRLIMKADDYGCFYGDTRLLKANLFPLLLDTVREADLLRWMAECQKAGLVVLYESEGKKYIQILDFRQRLDKAKSKFPLPNSTESLTVVNEFPAKLETEKELEKKEKNTGAPAAPPSEPLQGKKTRKNFVAPTHPELTGYFLLKVAKEWGDDKARREASECFDHYEANGWVQGKGKPIVDWKAAARNWMRREISGDFGQQPPVKKVIVHSASVIQHPVQAEKPKEIPLTQQQKEDQTRAFVQDLYVDFLDGKLRLEFVSTAAYDFLKKQGMMKSNVLPVEQIKQRAMEKRLNELKASKEPADIQLLNSLREFPDNWNSDNEFQRYCKTYSLLEFFEQLKRSNRKEVFYARQATI